MLQVLSVEETLTTQLISALEEDSKLARLLACRSLHSLLRLTTQRLNTDSLNKIYPGILNSSHILENNERPDSEQHILCDWWKRGWEDRSVVLYIFGLDHSVLIGQCNRLKHGVWTLDVKRSHVEWIVLLLLTVVFSSHQIKYGICSKVCIFIQLCEWWNKPVILHSKMIFKKVDWNASNNVK